jgi:hypothetical protein
MLRALACVALVGMLAIGGASWRERSRAARVEDGMAARRALATTLLAPPGVAPQAGISARAPIRVQPLPDRLARRLHREPDFQRLSHRCGVCHATPDPALHTSAEWPGVIARMSATIDAAGLLPLTTSDEMAILRVLRQHAAQAPPPR